MQNADLKKIPELTVYSKKRFINPRYQFITAVAMLFSVLAGALLESEYIWIPVIVCCMCTVLAVIVFRRRIVFVILLFVFSIGMLFYSSMMSKPEISAVSQEAELYTALAAEDSKNTENGFVSVVLKDVVAIKTGSELSHKIRLYIKEAEFCELYCGDRITFKAAVHEIEKPQNPGEANRRLIGLAQGIAFSAYADAEDINIINHETDFFSVFMDLRRKMIRNTCNMLPQEDAAIVNSVILGADEDVDQDFLMSLQKLGIVHVFSVSGLHVSIVALMLNYLLEKLRVGNWIRFFLGTVFIAGYVLISACSVSAIRAGIMAAALLLCKAIIQPYDSLNALSFAAVAVMLVNPLQVFLLGFQLSFLACVGIVFFARLFGGKSCRWWGKLLNAAGVTISAQIGTFPIVANAFGYIAPLSIAANILIVPIFSLILLLDLPLNVLILFFPPAEALLKVLYPLTWMIRWLIGMVGEVPVIPVAAFSAAAVMLYYGLMLLFSRFIVAKRKTKLICAICVLVLGFTVWGGQVLGRTYARITLLSTGNAMCAVVELPDRRCYLFDTGGSREVSEYIPNTAQTVAMPYLRKCGVKTVQGVFLSHGDGDHSGGLLAFRDQIGIETVFYNPKTIAQKRIQQCLMDWEQNGTQLEEVSAGDSVLLGEGSVHVLFPFADSETESNTSCVYKFSYCGITVLFTGDIEQRDSALLIERENIKCDIMVVPHHGSLATLYPPLLEKADAGLYLISSSEFAKDEYAYYPVLNTGQSGAIEIKIYSDGNYSVKEFKS